MSAYLYFALAGLVIVALSAFGPKKGEDEKAPTSSEINSSSPPLASGDVKLGGQKNDEPKLAAGSGEIMPKPVRMAGWEKIAEGQVAEKFAASRRALIQSRLPQDIAENLAKDGTGAGLSAEQQTRYTKLVQAIQAENAADEAVAKKQAILDADAEYKRKLAAYGAALKKIGDTAAYIIQKEEREKQQALELGKTYLGGGLVVEKSGHITKLNSSGRDTSQADAVKVLRAQKERAATAITPARALALDAYRAAYKIPDNAKYSDAVLMGQSNTQAWVNKWIASHPAEVAKVS